MKTMFTKLPLAVLAWAVAITLGFSQKIDVKQIEIDLSKDASKAYKKGNLLNLGTYWNEDKTELFRVFAYTSKDESRYLEVFTFNESGEMTKQETTLMSADALSTYNMEVAGSLLENDGPDISDQRYAYIRRTALAGQPTVNVGHFTDRYYRDVWYGYHFKEDEDYRLEERFWPDYSFVVQGSSVQNNSSHLLKKRTALGKVLQGQRNYIPMDGKVVLGGLMATSEQNLYLTGIYDLQKREWAEKHENVIDSKILQTGGSLEKADQQGVYTLLVCEKGYALLDIGADGKLKHTTWLNLENTQKKGVPENWDLKETGNGSVLLFHTIADGYSTKKMDIALFEVKDGQVLNQSNIAYDQQEEKMVQEPKSGVKLKRVTGFLIDELEALEDGTWALMAHTQKPDVMNVVFHLNKDLSLTHIFTIDAVPHIMEKASEEAFAGFLQGELYPAGDGKYYWLTRDIPGELLQGIHVDSESYGGNAGPGSIRTTTVTTTRIDEVYAFFKIALIDFNEGSISKAFTSDKLLAVGENPLQLSKNGKVLLNVSGTKSGDFYNLIIH